MDRPKTHEKTALQFVDADNFEREINKSTELVLAVFWAPWSRPCQIIDGVLKDVVATSAGNVTFLKVNADDNPHLSLCYGVASIPTLLCFVAGNLREKMVGTASKEAILSMLRRHGQADPGQTSAETGPT